MSIRKYRKSDFDDLVRVYGDFFNEMREWQGWQQLKLSQKEAAETAKGELGKEF